MSDPLDTGRVQYPTPPEPATVSTPKPSLVVEYDPETKTCRWAITGAIPHESLVWALKLIEQSMVTQAFMQLAQQQQASLKKRVVLPDGTPAVFGR